MSFLMQIANLNDLRPLLKLVNSINPEDPFSAWQQHKERIKAEITQKTEAAKPKSIVGFLNRSSAPKESPNLFDYIEKISKEERANHEKHVKAEIAQLKKMREDAEKKMIEDMKGQKFKLIDSLFGGAQPQQPAQN